MQKSCDVRGSRGHGGPGRSRLGEGGRWRRRAAAETQSSLLECKYFSNLCDTEAFDLLLMFVFPKVESLENNAVSFLFLFLSFKK